MHTPRAQLVIQKGVETGRAYIIRAGQKFTIGRSHGCPIKLNDSLVSRKHAVLEFSNGKLTVCDLGSRNGTYLDDKRLKPNAQISALSKDTLRVGDHVLEITVFGANTDLSDVETQKFPSLADIRCIPMDEFAILGEIGRGATGIVYGARQKTLKRNVALKVPRTDVKDYEECRQRFIREGQLCCKIDSPYVTTIYDLRIQGDRVFIVMELINGGSVEDRISHCVMPISEVAKIGEDIAASLAAIHRLNIIHRDLKPSNILLSPSGIAKLADFGIAKSLDTEGDHQERLTGSDVGLGTLGYVSPEAAACQDVGTKADIYSLGATLYHMLTNRPLFVDQGDSVTAVVDKIQSQPPPSIKDFRPDCPPALSGLIESMLEKNPNDRPANALVVAAKLEKIKAQYGLSYERTLPETDGFSREMVTDFI